jgi:hypothetical protein
VKADPNCAGQGIKLIKSFLKDSDIETKKHAALALSEIVKADTNFAGEGLDLIYNFF